jgi:type VI secretion system secreted protein Hcp
MAGQVFLTVYNQGNAFQHSVVFDKDDPASWVHEFDHQVLYLGDKLFFDKSPIRVHKPVRLLIPIDKITPSLIQLVVQGQTVEKTMLRWFRYQEKTKSDTEYFKHIFETVAFEQFRFVLPDVKNPQFDKHEFALEVSFRYKKVTWTYMQGNLIVSDEWQKSEYEDGEDVQEEEDDDDEMTKGITDAQVVEPAVEDTAKKVKLSDAKFLPEEGKTDFKQKCNVTVNVAYLKETNKKKVLFKLFSIYKNNTQDMQHEVEGFESAGKADAAVTLHYNDEYYTDSEKPSTAVVEYFVKVSHSEAEEIESERLKLPFKKQQTVQYVEIPDVLFNHNSAVPCIDNNNTLVGAIATVLIYANKNSDKEIVIYGHTDSSGETDYNIELSELRCKSIKALLDNKQEEYVTVCNGKFKVEDYQTILSIVTKNYQWDCDPGAIDNQNGPKTESALKKFQIQYNHSYGKSIDEDGKIGKQTWGAFFIVIHDKIRELASKEIGDTQPSLKYGKGGKGIYPCGEKYAQDAYAKKGRKSQKDRRVEVVFNDPSQPIEDTPYDNVIVMEPIVITVNPPQPQQPNPKLDPEPGPVIPDPNSDPKPDPKPDEKPDTKIKSITAQCQHTKEGIRKVFWGETLEITPDTIGDKVTFTVDATCPPENISWAGPGISAGTTGYSIKHTFSGIQSELENWLWNLASGLPPWVPKAPVKITATDTLSNDKKHVLVQIYPCAKKEYDFDAEFGKYLKKIKSITDTFQKVCDFLGTKGIEFKYLEGKITAYGQYKEASKTKEVFLSFGIEGGFKPLLGAKTEIKFPLDGLPWIPSALKKYIAEIAAVFELEGNINLVVYGERSEIKAAEFGGKISGEIVTKLGLSAQLWNGKLLDVKLLVISGITGEGKIFGKLDRSEKNDKLSLEAELSVEWNGLKGQISWNIFDGTIEDDLTITIKSPVKLWSKPFVLIGGKQND